MRRPRCIRFLRFLLPVLGLLALLASCSPAPATSPAENSAGAAAPLLPAELKPGEKLRVVATTNIVADVVKQIGGDHIELTALLPPGTDPHSYQATPDDLRKLNDAHVIFINGLHLEETMLPVLSNLDAKVPVVEVNAGVHTIEFAGGAHDEENHAAEEDHDHAGADPHTWMNVQNVEQWVKNAELALSARDPANAQAYAAAAAEYAKTLADLDKEIRAGVAALPPEKRKLVTDHDNLGYFADAYGFQIIGSVIPSLSTMAAASAQQIAALQDQIKQEGAAIILVGTTVNPAAAEQLGQDTGTRVVPIYTDSLSDGDGPAATYVDMMRFNANAILAALR